MSDDSPPVSPDAILGPDGAPQAQAAEAPARGLPPVQALEGREGQGLATGRDLGQVLGHAETPAGGLTRKSRDTALIAQRDARIRKKATDIVLSALRAPELRDIPETWNKATDPMPPGWTKRSMQIAADATNSMKAAPAYLGMAQRILESYRKAESETAHQPVLNAELIQVTVNQQVNNYPVRVLEED